MNTRFSSFLAPRKFLSIALLVLGLNASVGLCAPISQPHVGVQAIGLENFHRDDVKTLGQIIRLVGNDIEIASAPFSFVSPKNRRSDLFDKTQTLMDFLLTSRNPNPSFAGHVQLTTYLYFHDREYQTLSASSSKDAAKVPFNRGAIKEWRENLDWAKDNKPTKVGGKSVKFTTEEKAFLTELKLRCEIYRDSVQSLRNRYASVSDRVSFVYVPYLEDIGSSTGSNLDSGSSKNLVKFCEVFSGVGSAERRSPNNAMTRTKNGGRLELHSRKVFPGTASKLTNKYKLGTEGVGDCWSLDGDPKDKILGFADYEKYRAFALGLGVTPLYWNFRFNINDAGSYGNEPGYARDTLRPYFTKKNDKWALDLSDTGKVAATYYGLKGFSKNDKGYESLAPQQAVPVPTPSPRS